VKALALNRASLALSFAGLFVSGVLSVGAYYRYEIPCGASHGCDQVARDPSSHALGIPNAYVGLIAYILLTALSLWRMARSGDRVPLLLGFIASALGALASMVLTFYSVVRIQATCPWCLSSAVIMVLLLVVHAGLLQVGTDRVSAEDEPPKLSNAVFIAICSLATALALGIFSDGIVKEARGLDVVISEKDTPLTTFIPPNAHIYGDPNAPITIIEFGDLLCPSCQFEYSKVHEFIGLHPGAVRYVFREYPLVGVKGHEESPPAAVAAEIAAEKGLFWQFVDAMYAQPREGVTDTQPILDVAQSVGLDPNAIADRISRLSKEDPAFRRMKEDIDDGTKLGIHQTPTFFVYAKGVPGVRLCPIGTIWDELNQAPYTQFYKHG